MGGSEIHYIAYFKDYLNGFRNFEFIGLQNVKMALPRMEVGCLHNSFILKIFVSFENAVFLQPNNFLSFCLLILSLRKYLSFISIIFSLFFG